MSNKKLPPIYGDTESTLQHCCGVRELGAFTLEKDDWCDQALLSEITKYGIGYFVATFVKGQKESVIAQRRLRKDHTLVFSTPYITNMSPYAGHDEYGNRNKVKLCVFKHGKGK